MPGGGTLGDSMGYVHGLVGDDGYLNQKGQYFLIKLLEHVEPGNWGDAFIPLKKMGVHCAIELIILSDNGVLLTWWDDQFFHGWHTPGSYLNQEETWEEAAKRCARQELGADIVVLRTIPLEVMNNTDNPRFHDVTVLLSCWIPKDQPTNGKWFNECPENLISSQQKYRPVISTAIELWKSMRRTGVTFIQQRQTP